MKRTLFPKLAWAGIVKNKQLYIPYLLSCAGMVMMTYILYTLRVSRLLDHVFGGTMLGFILGLGSFVTTTFALVFLLYTSSFVTRRRCREFGLYSILGMDRRGIVRIVLWESLITAGISIAGGLILGIAFSKLAELGLLNAIGKDVDYSFTVYPKDIADICGLFAAVFAVMTLRSVVRVRRSDPLELLRSENLGEKRPRSNLLIAVFGVLLLGAAYYLSVSITDPISALLIFFFAVILVILATYILFMSGSVALCGALKKNKGYYYKKQHFISVSSMAFRMKRNGAGLASICILSTMVLVMLSSTASLYFGEQRIIDERCPHDTSLSVTLGSFDDLAPENIAALREAFAKPLQTRELTPDGLCEYSIAGIGGAADGDRIEVDYTKASAKNFMDGIRMVFFITAEDYDRLNGADVALSGNDALYYTNDCSFDYDTLSLGGISLNLVGKADPVTEIGRSSAVFSSPSPTIIVILSSFDVLKPLEELRYADGESLLEIGYAFSYDLPDADDETKAAVYRETLDALRGVAADSRGEFTYSGSCRAIDTDDFFITFGGLFFIGIILSILFIFAAALIIYYKQVTEGYEDRARFAIMRKVGMTSDDIKKSINSQILTVFFAPLLTAGLHLGFALPLVWRMLRLFGFRDLRLVILVTLAAFLLFGVFYAIIYKLTARAYYSIVSADDNE